MHVKHLRLTHYGRAKHKCEKYHIGYRQRLGPKMSCEKGMIDPVTHNSKVIRPPVA